MNGSQLEELARRVALLEARVAELQKRVDLLQQRAAPEPPPTVPIVERPPRREDDKSRPRAAR